MESRTVQSSGTGGPRESYMLTKESFEAVRTGVPSLDRAAERKLFGKAVKADDVLLRLLVHNHEHMGQLIAYARTNGVVPPWTAARGQ